MSKELYDKINHDTSMEELQLQLKQLQSVHTKEQKNVTHVITHVREYMCEMPITLALLPGILEML